MGNGKQPSNKKMLSVTNASWNDYLKDIVEEGNPERVIVIGEGAAKDSKADLYELG